MHYEYRITSDSKAFCNVREKSSHISADSPFMLRRADLRLEAGASWAEVQFVQVDDDGTVEVLRRLRLD